MGAKTKAQGHILARWTPAQVENTDEFEEEQVKPVTWADKFRVFPTQPGVEKLEALIVGEWEEPYETESIGAGKIVTALVEARAALPNLKALFFGDIVSEECEI